MHCNNNDQIKIGISFEERAGTIRPGREGYTRNFIFLIF